MIAISEINDIQRLNKFRLLWKDLPYLRGKFYLSLVFSLRVFLKNSITNTKLWGYANIIANIATSGGNQPETDAWREVTA